MREYNWKNLKDIDISDCQIDNIDILDKYPLLRSIKASNNKIEEVNLTALSKINEIDLSDNLIHIFPIFRASFDIVKYDISSNKLTSFFEIPKL